MCWLSPLGSCFVSIVEYAMGTYVMFVVHGRQDAASSSAAAFCRLSELGERTNSTLGCQHPFDGSAVGTTLFVDPERPLRIV
jgi:hypothetical protein